MSDRYTVTVACPRCDAEVTAVVTVAPTGVVLWGQSETCVDIVEITERGCDCEWTAAEVTCVEEDAIDESVLAEADES